MAKTTERTTRLRKPAKPATHSKFHPSLKITQQDLLALHGTLEQARYLADDLIDLKQESARTQPGLVKLRFRQYTTDPRTEIVMISLLPSGRWEFATSKGQILLDRKKEKK